MDEKLELVEKVLLQMKANLKKNVIKYLEEDDAYLTMICAEDLDLNRKALYNVKNASLSDEDSVWDCFGEDPLRYIATDVYSKDDQFGGSEETFYKVNEANGNLCTKKEIKEMLKELKEIYTNWV